MRFGRFTVEHDLEADTLVVIDNDMQHTLHIGGDQIDHLDNEGNFIESWEMLV